MIISARCHVAKQSHYCCNICKNVIFPGESYIRIFGSYESDPPYELKEHLKCIDQENVQEAREKVKLGKWTDWKPIIKAIDDFNKRFLPKKEDDHDPDHYYPTYPQVI